VGTFYGNSKVPNLKNAVKTIKRQEKFFEQRGLKIRWGQPRVGSNPTSGNRLKS